MFNVELQKIPVHFETEQGFVHSWAMCCNGKLIENRNNPDRLFGSISACKKYAAKHFDCGLNDLSVKLLK